MHYEQKREKPGLISGLVSRPPSTGRFQSAANTQQQAPRAAGQNGSHDAGPSHQPNPVGVGPSHAAYPVAYQQGPGVRRAAHEIDAMPQLRNDMCGAMTGDSKKIMCTLCNN